MFNSKAAAKRPLFPAQRSYPAENELPFKNTPFATPGHKYLQTTEENFRSDLAVRSLTA
jgi:hypothetical protein